eukprot:scaffold8290_cov136-Isochrysis_galbana.AAC.2
MLASVHCQCRFQAVRFLLSVARWPPTPNREVGGLHRRSDHAIMYTAAAHGTRSLAQPAAVGRHSSDTTDTNLRASRKQANAVHRSAQSRCPARPPLHAPRRESHMYLFDMRHRQMRFVRPCATRPDLRAAIRVDPE